MTSTTVTQEETIIFNHKARKQQVDQRGRSGIYRAPTNNSHKLSSRKVEEFNIIKIKMRRYPESSTSETYELKDPTFENDKPEEFLYIMKDSKTATDRTGTTFTTRKIQFLHTILRGESLREFDVLERQVGSKTNGNLKLIKEGLLGYFTPPSTYSTSRNAP